MNILLYGGSFDPIHTGHLIVANNVIEKLNIDKCIFIPSNITPLKNRNLKANNIHRYNMIRESIKNNSKFEVSDFEITKEEISYTYYTVKHFKELYKNSELYFLIGTDRVKDLQHWHKTEKLKELVTFVFTERDSEKLENIISHDDFYNSIKYVILKLPVVEISSTIIREKIKSKKNIDYLVDYNCYKYIKEHKLYEF